MLGRTHNFKSARLQARRRKRIIGSTVLIVFCLASLWGLLFWLSGLQAITIQNIEVAGTTSVSPTDITTVAENFLAGRYFFTVPRNNILFYPKVAIEKSILKSYPQVKQVAVSFKNFHTIGISVAERHAVAWWCQNYVASSVVKGAGENCFLVDGSGLIFAPSPEVASTSPQFIKFYSALPKENPIGQSYLSTSTPASFDRFLGFAKNLNTLGFTVSLFRERPDTDFEAQFSGGQSIIFARDADFASVFNNFQTIVSDPNFASANTFSTIDYIDLRYGNKVFYKTK